MIQTLTDSVLVLTAFLLIILTIVLLVQKNINILSRNLLVAFLLSKAFLNIRWLVFNFRIIKYADFTFFYFISKSGFFLLAPLLFLYVKSLCQKNFQLKKIDLLHLIPFSLILVFESITATLLLSESAATNTIFYAIFVTNQGKIFWTSNLIQILLYIITMLRMPQFFGTKTKDLYSPAETKNLKWLKSLLLLLVFHWIFITSQAVLITLNISNRTLLSLLSLYSIVIFLVFATILVFKGLKLSKIFSVIEEKSKYANSPLPDNIIKKYANDLSDYMKNHKPYLISSLTLNDLSENLSIPSWQLSQIINEHFQQNFFNYINSHRIEEAKRLLSDSNNGHRTVLEILYEVGFNSKSAFNIAFKKHTGITPSQFKNSH